MTNLSTRAFRPGDDLETGCGPALTRQENAVFARCAWRVIPLFSALWFVSLLDRVNVGFAALTMNRDLGFSPPVFGFGAGVFFAGYVLFQIPANLLLVRIGPQRWLFCILTIWGITSASTAFVTGPDSFYAMRFVLGLAEAGCFPALIASLSYWFPRNHHARLTAIFMSGGVFANVIDGPLAAFILQSDGAAGLRGWQWLFLIEGVPALTLAFVVLFLLPDEPGQALWLSAVEKQTISTRLAADTKIGPHEFWTAFTDARVYALGLVYLGIAIGIYGLDLWLPLIVQSLGFSNLAVGFLTALPFSVAIAAQCLWGWSSDRNRERIWHIALPALVTALASVSIGFVPAPFGVIAMLIIARSGINATFGPFWSFPAEFLRGPAAAGGIALISTIAYVGGFIGPFVIGVLKQQTGGYAAGMAALALAMTASAVIVLALGRTMTPRRQHRLLAAR